jgi:hypothetical protein
MSGASARNSAEEPGLINSKTLDEYRALFRALEAEDREAASLPSCSRSAIDAADAAGRLRDALEDGLFEDYNRLGFASESEDSPVRRRGGRLSSDERAQVRSALSSGMTQAAVALKFGIAQSAVSFINSRPAEIRRPRLSHEDMQTIRESKSIGRILAKQFGVSQSRISAIKSGL